MNDRAKPSYWIHPPTPDDTALAAESLTNPYLQTLLDELTKVDDPQAPELQAVIRSTPGPHVSQQERWEAICQAYMLVDQDDRANAVLRVTYHQTPTDPHKGYPDDSLIQAANGLPEGYYPAGAPTPPKADYREIWAGWGLPTRILLFGRAGAGKSTVAALIANWYRTHQKTVLVVCAGGEAVDEWIDLRDQSAQDWDIYDWSTREGLHPHIQDGSLQPWDVVIVDPLIGLAALLNISEQDSDLYRRIHSELITPLLTTNGTILFLAHIGWEHRNRPRGTSDAYGWPRLAMRYERQEGTQTGRLTKTKANRTSHTYPTLTIHQNSDHTYTVVPLESQVFLPTGPKLTLAERIKTTVDEQPGITTTELADLLNTPTTSLSKQVNIRLVKRDTTQKPYRFYPLPSQPPNV